MASVVGLFELFFRNIAFSTVVCSLYFTFALTRAKKQSAGNSTFFHEATKKLTVVPVVAVFYGLLHTSPHVGYEVYGEEEPNTSRIPRSLLQSIDLRPAACLLGYWYSTSRLDTWEVKAFINSRPPAFMKQ